MKDHLGRYWCYECGAADQLKRGAGLALKCPDCNHHFPPTKMLKHGEEYVCETCHDERRPAAEGAGSRAGALAARRCGGARDVHREGARRRFLVARPDRSSSIGGVSATCPAICFRSRGCDP